MDDKPCLLCNNGKLRTYTHSRNKYHKKKLFEIMKERKNNGYYFNNKSILSNVSLSKN